MPSVAIAQLFIIPWGYTILLSGNEGGFIRSSVADWLPVN